MPNWLHSCRDIILLINLHINIHIPLLLLLFSILQPSLVSSTWPQHYDHCEMPPRHPERQLWKHKKLTTCEGQNMQDFTLNDGQDWVKTKQLNGNSWLACSLIQGGLSSTIWNTIAQTMHICNAIQNTYIIMTINCFNAYIIKTINCFYFLTLVPQVSAPAPPPVLFRFFGINFFWTRP